MSLYENVVAWLQANLGQEFYSQIDRFGIIGIEGPKEKFTKEFYGRLTETSLQFGAEGTWEYIAAPDGEAIVIAFTPTEAQALAQAEMNMYLEKIGYSNLIQKYNLSTDPEKCSKMPHEHALVFIVAATMLENRFSCFEEAEEMIHLMLPQVPEFAIAGEKLDHVAAREVMVEAYRRAFAPIN